jgi:prophage DNA circulation protein
VIKYASIIRIAGAAAFAAAMASAAAPTFAFAHEGHQMECSDSSRNAMKADIQAMPDGKSKTTAIKEMQAAQDMIQKKDMKACAAHMHTAMEAMEK